MNEDTSTLNDTNVTGFSRKKVLSLLGIPGEHHTPADVYTRINQLTRAEQAETRLLREREIYRLALKLKETDTPLFEIARYLDSHTGNGDVSQVNCGRVSALCRELEQARQRADVAVMQGDKES